jgi:hypothetical protein
MIKLNQLIYHKKSFLNEEQCKFIISEYDKLSDNFKLESCPEASTNIETYSTFKRVELIEGTEAFNLVHKSTETVINEYVDYLDSFKMFHVMLKDKMLFSHMYRLLKYEVGAKIHPHTDHNISVYGSCTFNLNDEYTGGEFSFWRGKYDISLGRGDVLIFPADFYWVHEVKPIKTGVRYSTNSFLQDVPESMRKQLFQFKSRMLKKELEGNGIYHNEMKNRYKIKNETKVD